MKIVIAGASGLIGTTLVRALRGVGHDVFRLVRRAAQRDDEITWDPAAGRIDAARLAGVEAAVNLAGENVGHRWTSARRERILRSRVEATRTLVDALGRLEQRPRVLLNASAVGFYGNRGDELLTETSPIGHGFLPEVCLAWETHAGTATRLGIRTVMLRFGTVLAPNDGALARMLPLFRLGLGGPLGNGRQWMSWISIDDVVGAVLHVLNDTRCSGPVNTVAPEPVTNAQFTRVLARAIHRPAVLPAPAFALRLVFGGMADEALLASTRAQPKRLLDTGYTFRHATLPGALGALLGQAAGLKD